MPKKEHKLETVAITEETKEEVARIAKERNCFEYEVIEQAVKEYLLNN